MTKRVEGEGGGKCEIRLSWMAPAWPSRGGESIRTVKLQGVEAPWPLALAQKSTQQRDQETEDANIRKIMQGCRGGGTGETEVTATGEPPRG